MASECMRIRLPWPRKSVAALSDFASYKQVLANLKSDPALFTYLDSIEIIEAIPDIFFNPLKEKLKIFLYD